MSTAPAAESVARHPVVCTGCGCFCDDILALPREPLSQAHRLCDRGVDYFEQLPGLDVHAWVGGQLVSLDDAVREAARLLAAASAPGILGLELVSIETCAAAARLATRLHAWLCPWPPDPTRFWGQLAPDLALSRAEIEQGADLILYLGEPPDTIQPRHRERHLRRGLGDARHRLLLPSPSFAEVVRLRLHFERADPLPDALTLLADAIRSARCVQVFFDAALAACEPVMVHQWQLLAAKARQHRRFGVAVLGGSKARTTTEALTWLTGYPGPILFTEAGPCYRPDVGEADELLRRSAVDTVLWLGLDPRRPRKEVPSAANVRHIHISAQPDLAADIAFQVPGLDPRLDGHVIREDGVMLRLAGARPAAEDRTPGLLDRLTAGVAHA